MSTVFLLECHDLGRRSWTLGVFVSSAAACAFAEEDCRGDGAPLVWSPVSEAITESLYSRGGWYSVTETVVRD